MRPTASDACGRYGTAGCSDFTRTRSQIMSAASLPLLNCTLTEKQHGAL